MSQTTQHECRFVGTDGYAASCPLLSSACMRTSARSGVDPERPSGRGFIALLEAFRATGGTVPGVIMGRLLQDHQVGKALNLAGIIHSGRVFGFEWRASLWIPMFQFDADNLAVKAGAQRVRAELPPLWSGWTVASWFAGPNARLEGCSPADMLDTNLEAVVHAARSLASVADFVPAAATRERGRRARVNHA